MLNCAAAPAEPRTMVGEHPVAPQIAVWQPAALARASTRNHVLSPRRDEGPRNQQRGSALQLAMRPPDQWGVSRGFTTGFATACGVFDAGTRFGAVSAPKDATTSVPAGITAALPRNRSAAGATYGVTSRPATTAPPAIPALREPPWNTAIPLRGNVRPSSSWISSTEIASTPPRAIRPPDLLSITLPAAIVPAPNSWPPTANGFSVVNNTICPTTASADETVCVALSSSAKGIGGTWPKSSPDRRSDAMAARCETNLILHPASRGERCDGGDTRNTLPDRTRERRRQIGPAPEEPQTSRNEFERRV